MLRSCLLAAAGILGLTAAALAADLPSRRAPAVVPVLPTFTWSGVYAGVNAGYGFSSNRTTTFCTAPAGGIGGAGCAIAPGLNTDSDGFVGGGQLGYNLQIGSFVAGFETDIQYTDIGRNRSFNGAIGFVGTPVTVPGVFSVSDRLDYLGTVRGRIGFAMDRVLVYGTGGFAYGGVRLNQSLSFPGAGTAFVSGRSDTETGYAAGGGLEYAFTDNLTVKGEALYYDLGQRTLRAGSVPATGFVQSTRFETEGVIARAGLNYKFGLF